MTKSNITPSDGVWLLPILFALFTFNAVGDTLSFAHVELDPSYQPAFPPPPGTTSASFTGTINGATNSAAANLATGMLGVLNAGNSVTTPGVYETIAQIGDTITATGSASGLTGLDLGVNISEKSTTSFSDSSGNFSWLWVFMFTPGTFDQTQFTTLPNILVSRGYLLGNGTNTNIADALFAANNVAVDGTFGDGTNTIPLQIPFNTIGSNFQIELVLGSAQDVTGIGSPTWSADFLDPLNVTLSAPAGVTLTSASGLLPGTVGAVPEPSTLPLAGTMIALVIIALEAKRRRKTA
ncbi:MAG TPA: hypothetical protein VGP62_11780 [Bryobacteraceae bacterium]|nr:hypothetical protein [Bryobacteraceae bacterium]